MKKLLFDVKTICIYVLVIAVFLIIPLLGNRAITVYSESLNPRKCVIIDAGHGGIDCGAVSCTGAYESHINLEIAKKLRDTDRSVYTNGNTIASQKVSDIKERVRIVNTTPNALLVSIHQNNFSDAKYSGAQIFYNAHPESKALADKLQITFRENLNVSNKRTAKRTSGVYLMEHINSPGILVECGFLSNREEEIKLRDEAYQKAICIIIGTTVYQYLNT